VATKRPKSTKVIAAKQQAVRASKAQKAPYSALASLVVVRVV
jgi:hypothetical protein